MKKEFFYDSCGEGKIYACRWEPEGQPRAIVQIVHGIVECVERYDAFAAWLASKGYLVVAEDHMGHGRSIQHGGTKGYFCGGWFAAVEDTCKLLRLTRQEYPDAPYILFGHSMGSFMARTILAKHPELGLRCCVLSGTAWMPSVVLNAGVTMSKIVCALTDERKPNKLLHATAFGSYNARVEHPRTDYDWLTRDKAVVDQYIAHPMCGFVAAAGLMRDMMQGIRWIQQSTNLAAMNKSLPVLFVAGGADPVGDYGKGVNKAADAFSGAGMVSVDRRIYPMCRHEILNEINKQEIWDDILNWMEVHI